MFSRKTLLYGVAALALLALAVTAGKDGNAKPPPPPPPPPDPAILYTVGYGGHDNQIWAMNADGTNKTPIISIGTHGIAAMKPSWSGDNERFVFVGLDAWAEYALYLAGRDGSNVTWIHDMPDGSGDPDWSPAPLPGQPVEEEWIIFVEYIPGYGQDLLAIAIQGGMTRGPFSLMPTEDRYETNPSVSFDGKFVFYGAVTYPQHGGDGQYRVYRGVLGTAANGDPMITSEECLTAGGTLASLNCDYPIVDPTGKSVAVSAAGDPWIISLPGLVATPSAVSEWYCSFGTGSGAWLDDHTVVYTVYVGKPRQFFLAKDNIFDGGAEQILASMRGPAISLGHPATRR